MKYIFWLLMLTELALNAQTDYSVDELPALTSPANSATQYLYILDGTTDKHITTTTLFGVLNDTADAVRGELADTAAKLRSEISGGGAWSASGNIISLTSSDDSVGIGTSSPTAKLAVDGEIQALSVVAATVGPSSAAYLDQSYGQLYFHDAIYPSGLSLSTIAGGSIFGLTGTTRYTTTTTDNWHFGGTSATTNKLNVTGNIYATTGVAVPTGIGLYSGTSYIYETAGTSNRLNFNVGGVDRMRVTENGAAHGILWSTYFYSTNTSPPSGTLSEGMFYYNSTVNSLLVYNGTTWDTLGTKDNYFADSVYLQYLDGASGPMFAVITPTGAIDSGWLDRVYRGLTDKLWDVKQVLSDKKDGEIAWYHVENDKLVKQYGLSRNMDAFEELQYAQEQTLRLISKQQDQIEGLKLAIIVLLVLVVLIAFLRR